MELSLIRTALSTKSSTGSLFIDGNFECFTLEDAVRPVKIKGLTAIPYGAYEVVLTWSARFKRLLPLLLNVPGFDGIRIHAGNTDADTDGCILVGATQSADFIGRSRPAFEALFRKLSEAAAREKIFIQIEAAEAGASAPVVSSVAVRVAGARSVRRSLTAKVKAGKAPRSRS